MGLPDDELEALNRGGTPARHGKDRNPGRHSRQAVRLWTTVTPSYSDRAFRITKNTLTFHVSPQDSTFHPIVRVRETEYMEEQKTTEYTVFYTH